MRSWVGNEEGKSGGGGGRFSWHKRGRKPPSPWPPPLPAAAPGPAAVRLPLPPAARRHRRHQPTQAPKPALNPQTPTTTPNPAIPRTPKPTQALLTDRYPELRVMLCIGGIDPKPMWVCAEGCRAWTSGVPSPHTQPCPPPPRRPRTPLAEGGIRSDLMQNTCHFN